MGIKNRAVLGGAGLLALGVAGVLAPGTASAAASAELETLHTFTPGLLGDGPYAPGGGVIQASDGHLYGVTSYGGEGDDGAVYRLTLTGTFATVYSFGAAASDGVYPRGSLVQAADGNL